MSNVEQDADVHNSVEDTEEIPQDRALVEHGQARTVRANFRSSEQVAITIEEKGVLKPGILLVHAMRPIGRSWEYQLKDSNGKLYLGGRWIAQKDINKVR